MNCIRCGKKVKETKYNEVTFYKGVILSDYCGFGSKFDGDKITISICDSCIEKNKNLIKLEEND